MFQWLINSILFAPASIFYVIFIWFPFMVTLILVEVFNFITFDLFNLLFFGKSRDQIHSIYDLKPNPIYLLFLAPVAILAIIIGVLAILKQLKNPETPYFRSFLRALPRYFLIAFLLPILIYFSQWALKLVLDFFLSLLDFKSAHDEMWQLVRFPEWNANRGWDAQAWSNLANSNYMWDKGHWSTTQWGDTMLFFISGLPKILIQLMIALNFTLAGTKIIFNLFLKLTFAPLINIQLLRGQEAQTKAFNREIKSYVLSYFLTTVGFTMMQYLNIYVDELTSMAAEKVFGKSDILQKVSWLVRTILSVVIMFSLSAVFSKFLEKFVIYMGLDSEVDFLAGNRTISAIGGMIVPKIPFKKGSSKQSSKTMKNKTPKPISSSAPAPLPSMPAPAPKYSPSLSSLQKPGSYFETIKSNLLKPKSKEANALNKPIAQEAIKALSPQEIKVKVELETKNENIQAQTKIEKEEKKDAST
ncbi:Mbov_0396 family ICE element transmembrane protein [Mycoplasmopsis sturni]|uniref:Mbov_0396 family ICE element transmembrane protein n=1 Tax=Mycoplasmopsis sturni TaxID=39047 RepID=UPI00056C4DA2|nr:hypothetical protein [Mycoplasmopsis sturni]